MVETDSGENLINVTSQSIRQISEEDTTLKTILSSFCSVSLKIRRTISSALGKNSFREDEPSQMIGKGSN